jgi:hypothetical protein
LIGLDHGIVDLDDVRMIKPPPDRILGLEQLAQTARHRRVVLAELDQLDGDFALRIRIARQIDDRRRPFAKGSNDFVFADFSAMLSQLSCKPLHRCGLASATCRAPDYIFPRRQKTCLEALEIDNSAPS